MFIARRCDAKWLTVNYSHNRQVYEWFNIEFDYFGRTTTPKQTEIAQDIFLKAYRNKLTTESDQEQLYCEKCQVRWFELSSLKRKTLTSVFRNSWQIDSLKEAVQLQGVMQLMLEVINATHAVNSSMPLNSKTPSARFVVTLPLWRRPDTYSSICLLCSQNSRNGWNLPQLDGHPMAVKSPTLGSRMVWSLAALLVTSSGEHPFHSLLSTLSLHSLRIRCENRFKWYIYLVS